MEKNCILGISSGFHDSAVALTDRNCKVLFAIQEERLIREKGYRGFPYQGINYIKEYCSENDLNIIALTFFERPVLRLKNMLSIKMMLIDNGG